ESEKERFGGGREKGGYWSCIVRGHATNRRKNEGELQRYVGKSANKLKGWKSKCLSFAGRCTLAHSVLNPILNYSMQHERVMRTLLVALLLYNAKMSFKRFVEIGRVAFINYGKEHSRLVVIVDVMDQNRALVDAPDMVSSQVNFKRLSLTGLKVDIKRDRRKNELIKAMEDADVKNKWEKSSWGRKLIVKKTRVNLNDFDRFKLMLVKIKKAVVVRQKLAKLKKDSS
ncbi:hypothetical protein PIB30_091668, partial [Stylosanthes scabra]|nr:hypothetical protein [Stylosanthes scabra]